MGKVVLLGEVKLEFETGDKPRVPIRRAYIIWWVNIVYQIAYHALPWWYVVSRQRLNA